MDIDKIEEKVRMMLAKAASSTFEAERETFTAAAEKLIIKHKLDRDSLSEEKRQSIEIGWKDIRFEQYSQKWFRDVASRSSSFVMKAMGYQGIWYKTNVAGSDYARIYADEDMLDIMEDLLLHIAGQCFGAMEAWWKKEQRFRGGSANVTAGERSIAKRDFCLMFFSKVANRIEQEKAEEAANSKALVLSNVRYLEAADNLHGPSKSRVTKTRDAMAVVAGGMAGEEADIHGRRRVS